MKWIVHDFWLSFMINNEQIKPNLNNAFANKYHKIQCWLRNFDNFWEILNRLISLLRMFVYHRSIQKNYLLLGFGFAYFKSHRSYLQFFLRFQSIQSIKWITIVNGKKSTIHCYLLQIYCKVSKIRKYFSLGCPT